jgi:L-asparaginase
MSRVALVFTGGTIAMEPDPATGGARPTLRGGDILARTPGLDEVAEIEPIDWGLVPASHFRFDQLLDLARLLERTLARPDIDGAVVVQGTDTIEETAFAYDLLLSTDKPLVVTGAMRNAAAADYDGPRNLTDAVRCAASPDLRGQGTVVVLNGLIVGADQAVKSDTTALDTFRPRTGYPLGRVVDDAVEVTGPRRSRVVLPQIPVAAAEPVFLLTVTVAMDGAALRALAALRPAGVVVAATGAGNTDPDVLAAARELMAGGVVVCLTTRCPTGAVAPLYAFPGGGSTWQQAGALLSGLDGPKCRVALALALGAGLAGERLRAVLRSLPDAIQ